MRTLELGSTGEMGRGKEEQLREAFLKRGVAEVRARNGRRAATDIATLPYISLSRHRHPEKYICSRRRSHYHGRSVTPSTAKLLLLLDRLDFSSTRTVVHSLAVAFAAGARQDNLEATLGAAYPSKMGRGRRPVRPVA